MTRREALSAMAAVPGLRADAKRRPNLLFLIADDHAGYVLGCDGNPQARTPNLDRLAAGGTRFAGHNCNSPVCTPSRQSLLTGQMPHMAGVTRLPTSLDPAKPTLAKSLKAAGYSTAAFGKMHFNRRGEPGLYGFDTMLTDREANEAWMRDVKPRPAPPDIPVQGPWRPFKVHAREWLNAEKRPYGRIDEEMRGSYIARRAVQHLEAQAGKPFALWVSLNEPHSPFDFPLEDRELFRPGSFRVPVVGPQDRSQIPLIFRDLSDAEKQGINAAYYTSVAFLDRNMGRVLDALTRLKLEEDTLVVYTADHGYCLGHHGRFEKHCGYDPALRVPLIFRWPGRVREGVVREMTEHLDVAPTILELLGLDPLSVQHGQSLRSYLESGAGGQSREYVFSEYLENEEAFLRSHDHKFIFGSGKRRRTDGYETDRPTPGRYRRLFDLKRDPGEFEDISSKAPAAVDSMEKRILETFRLTHPEASAEPQRLSRAEAIEWYLRPRDADVV